MTSNPYNYWKLTHATHHRENGDLTKRPWTGNIPLLTVEEFSKLSSKQKKRYAITRNAYTLLLYGWAYYLYIHHIRIPQNNKWLLKKSILLRNRLTTLTQLIIFILIAIFLSLKYLFLALILPTALGYAIGIFLFYIQHNFEHVYLYEKQEKPSATSSLFIKTALEGSSCLLLPFILRWFTANIGYHHIHHLCPKIPFYNLKKAYDENEELQTAHKLTLKSAFKQFSYKLYDVNTRKLLTWKDYKNIHSSSPIP